jgi:hypothetical protein
MNSIFGSTLSSLGSSLMTGVSRAVKAAAHAGPPPLAHLHLLPRARSVHVHATAWGREGRFSVEPRPLVMNQPLGMGPSGGPVDLQLPRDAPACALAHAAAPRRRERPALASPAVHMPTVHLPPPRPGRRAGEYVAERLGGGRRGIERVIHIDPSPAMLELAKARGGPGVGNLPRAVPFLPRACAGRRPAAGGQQAADSLHPSSMPHPGPLQARRAALQEVDPSKQWPDTEYVVADEEALPLEPGSVDGERGGLRASLNVGVRPAPAAPEGFCGCRGPGSLGLTARAPAALFCPA